MPASRSGSPGNLRVRRREVDRGDLVATSSDRIGTTESRRAKRFPSVLRLEIHLQDLVSGSSKQPFLLRSLFSVSISSRKRLRSFSASCPSRSSTLKAASVNVVPAGGSFARTPRSTAFPGRLPGFRKIPDLLRTSAAFRSSARSRISVSPKSQPRTKRSVQMRYDPPGRKMPPTFRRSATEFLRPLTLIPHKAAASGPVRTPRTGRSTGRIIPAGYTRSQNTRSEPGRGYSLIMHSKMYPHFEHLGKRIRELSRGASRGKIVWDIENPFSPPPPLVPWRRGLVPRSPGEVCCFFVRPDSRDA